MSDITTAILERRREAQRLTARIKSATSALLKTEDDLAALIKAANILGISVPEDGHQEPDGNEDDADIPGEGARHGRGRKPGAISKDWRAVLEYLWLLDGAFDYQSIHTAALSHGMQNEISSTRERVRRFVEQGYLSGDADVGFSVTPEAADRFGFGQKEEVPTAGAEGTSKPEEIKADDLDAPL